MLPQVCNDLLLPYNSSNASRQRPVSNCEQFPGLAGLGRAAALAFAQNGSTKIALLDLNETGLQATKQLIHEISAAITVGTYKTDVTSHESVKSTFAAVVESFGRIDYSIQCAGIATFDGSTADCKMETFESLLNILFRGVWLCHREAIRTMRTQSLDCEAYPTAGIHPLRAQRGSVLSLSSTISLHAFPGSTAYASTKNALQALARGDAIDYAPDRIRVNCLLPGIFDTPMNNPSPEISKLLHEKVVVNTPMRRLGLPEELADTIIWISSNKASFVTGANWIVDGGASSSMFQPPLN